MPSLLQHVAGSNRLLWLDDTDYAARLLAGGKVPWRDAGEYVAWRRKAQNLLRSSVIALPVGRLYAAWLREDASLRAALSGRNRVNHPLKTLLAAAPLRRHVTEVLTGLRASFPSMPLALVCPSPRAWVRDAHIAAFGESAPRDLGEDEIDAATLHCADFLREFSTTGLDTVLLEESAESEPSTPSEIDWYRSVWNVGAHYRWEMGLRVRGLQFGAIPTGVDYLIAPASLKGACAGVTVAEEFWSGAQPAPLGPAQFRFATVPLDLAPETILERLADLR